LALTFTSGHHRKSKQQQSGLFRHQQSEQRRQGLVDFDFQFESSSAIKTTAAKFVLILTFSFVSRHCMNQNNKNEVRVVIGNQNNNNRI
jgi:hypothetical protein